MNFERGFLTPRHGNGDSCSFVTQGMPIPRDSRIGHSQDAWTTTMLQGSEVVGGGEYMVTPRPIPVDNGIVSGRESQNTINPQHPTSMGNGVAANRDKQATTTKKTMLLRNGIVQNANDWNSVIPGNSFPSRKGNGIDQSKNSWTPVTPEKLINERPNTIAIDTQENRLGNENWQDLIGMYTNLLQEETLDLKGLIAPPPMIHKNGNQNWVASTTKRDLNPRPSPSTYPDHTSNQASTSLSYFDTNDPANWNGNLLATNVGSNRNSTCISPANEAQNNGILASNRPLIPNPSTQVGSNHKNSGYIRSMLGSQQTQNFTPNGVHKVISNQDNAKDSFPVRYQPCYSPSSPPGSAPDAASSSIMGTFPFATITPDNQRKHIDNQWLPENVNFPVEETSTPAKDRHANQTVPIADTENLYNELFRTIGDSPSSAISTTQKIRVISEDGDEQGIDLNNTPQQKTPARRKKHRPKVIREGKPKRTPKPKDPRKGTSNEARVKRKYVKKKDVGISETQHGDGAASVGKRKYVRKKGIDNLGSQQKSRVDDVVTSVVETPAKSCKKQLNFDLECVAKHESHDIGGRQQGTNANVNPQDIEQERRVNSMLETSAMKITQQNKYMAETMQGGNQYTLPELNVPTTPLAKARGHTLNVLARNITMRNFVPGENRQENKYNQVNQHVHGEGITNMVFEASNPQYFASKGMLSFDERRGIKRQNSEQMYHRNVNAMDSLPLYQKLLLGVAHRNDYSNNLSSIFLENHKKTKMRSEFQALISSEPSCIAPLEDKLRQEARQMNGIYGNTSAMQLLNSCTERVHPTHKAMNVGANVNNRQFRPPMAATHDLLKHQVLSGMQPHTIRSVAERSQNYTPGHEISSVLAMVKWNSLPPAPPKEASRYAITTCPATLLEKKQSTKSYPYNQRLNGLNEMLPQHSNYALDGHHRSSTIAQGPARRQKAEVSVDYVTYKLEGLRIYEENEKEQNALVLYRGSKAIIPFEPIKKRNPRPKVDLDPETERLWKLLMGKEGSEGAETLDKDKEKWWEDERRVFRGRADSFIARMHLVQGDRRFSRWKGSVVDSVIGVFLTQNVSDHLSSSAFMSLAAKFPLKSTTTSETSCQDGACEGPIEVAEPNDIMKCHEKIRRNSVSDQSSFASCESSENMACHISSTRSAANKHSRISEEEVILSQDSFDSSTIQTVDEIRSSSGSNSEAEDVTIGFETSKQSGTPLNLIQTEKPTVFKDHSHHHNWSTLLDEQATNMHRLPKEPVDDMQIPRMNGVYLNNSSRFTPANSSIHFLQESLALSSQFQVNVTPGSQKVGSLHFRMLEGESASSLPSSSSGITEAYHTSNVTYPQNQMPTFQAPTLGQHNLLSSHPAHQENFQPGPHVGSSQLLNTSHQQETKTRGHAETLGKGINGAQKEDSAMFGGITINVEGRISVADKQNCLENTVAEANSKQQNYAFHEPPSGAGTNMSKARKGTAEDEKNRATDWDSLRKQVLSNGEKRKQSKDATDSLDYEALRRANVNEISDAIRERGMNNLLADRIKEFLNRLVRDHGKIDLEWLRDAPPDKAKDYLLSFRGLGLKSVECVRLLTLHHLAFPVDTNVGRIAVRLGWVPLQPLPESLQLHLLEMYPVLESIQKYLWPRLCKLDQLTLYELHYQMITFGKVFCTKSKPNCNACPMRAECRHFASAFASARLALPGPDEKRIVTSDAPIATDPTPPVVIRPMPLPRSEDDYNKNAEVFGKNCEPIIEEPTTPEPETTELSISDIEDQYYEDSDEIPSIKLNMVEFTTNLQNIMQDNMELQDNMSKALVALNPNAASIPTPKLKDVSRLRTEHQVYELPDSHQLLEGLDKREPDDPSPYLLAIWTPGETANSVQPPERECSAQESGKLCDKTTCFSCNSIKEANTHVVRGTILIPCRTAMQGSFPLNGTYFQVNEMFADHASSLNPIDVPRSWIWNLPRRTVYFGTSVSTIFKGLTTEGIQYCFWKGFVCVRGFDQKTRAPRPLMARLHFPASKLVKTKNGGK